MFVTALVTHFKISLVDKYYLIYLHFGRDRKTRIFNGLYRFNYMRYGSEINIQTALFFCIDIFCIITVNILLATCQNPNQDMFIKI